MTATCETCQHWEPRDQIGPPLLVKGVGFCEAVAGFYQPDAPFSVVSLVEAAEPYATLRTRADFGCVRHEPRA